MTPDSGLEHIRVGTREPTALSRREAAAVLEKSARELAPGTVLDGRYEIQARLGTGTFSSVYQARDRLLGTDYALKVLRNMGGADEESLTRFKREALLSQRIGHEDCCRVYDFLSIDGLSVLKMELVNGWTLAQLLTRLRPIPMPLALSLSVQSCAAVGVLHRQSVIHRDLKASNLMVTRSGRIKVMDLGVSWAPELSSLTMAGTLLGTPSYMAPELILHQKSSARSDVYALGALAYYLLCGRLPFSAPDLVKLFMMQVQQAPVPPKQLRPELSDALESLVLRCLDKEAENRPADAVELEAQLRDELGVQPDPKLVASTLNDLEALLEAVEPVLDLHTATFQATARPAAAIATQPVASRPQRDPETAPASMEAPAVPAPVSEPPVGSLRPEMPPVPGSHEVGPSPEASSIQELSLGSARHTRLVRSLVLVLVALLAAAAAVVGILLGR
jgi:serine/threonine-protein kinase